MGTRIQSISATIPKALIPINGKAFILLKLSELEKQNVREVFILVGHFGEQIVEHLESFYSGPIKIRCIDDGEKPLGTGGAIIANLEILPETFILTYGDNLLVQGLRQLIDEYKNRKLTNLVCCTEKIQSDEKYNVSAQGGKLVSYSKDSDKFKGNLLEYGYSIWSKKFLIGQLFGDYPLDMSQIFEKAAAHGGTGVYETDLPYFEIGTPQGLARTTLYIESQESFE